MPLLSSFVLILLAELPDKTLYTILLLATRNRPLPVLLGAWVAFLVHGFIALAIGSLLAGLPAWLLSYGTASLFLGFGLFSLFRRGEAVADGRPLPAPRALMTTFGLVFLAEWGDATQIGTGALVARIPEHPWQVPTGATLGLWAGAALAVGVGRTAGRWLPQVCSPARGGRRFLRFRRLQRGAWTLRSKACPLAPLARAAAGDPSSTL